MRRRWWIGFGALLAGAAAAWGFVYGGAYDVAATTPHWQPVHGFLETVMRHSVQRRARDVVAPAGARRADTALGAACVRTHCALCHGAPGIAPAPLALALQPLPSPLVDAGKRWSEAELYWITRYGIRMSGMPAWEHRLSEEQMWAVARFVAQLPALSPQQYGALQQRTAGLSCAADAGVVRPPVDAGSVERGRAAIEQHGCRGCHIIDGIAGSEVHVGPALRAASRRLLIAGRLANTPENMARWIEQPARWKPGTAMPALGVSPAEARDMAAYLEHMD